MIIKKLNTVFHKHSKILFGAFTLIIIVAFMDFLTPGRGGCDGANGGSQKVGEVYGKDVTYGDLWEFYGKYSAVRQEHDLDWQDVFFMYGLNVRADQLGIHVSDDEVAQEIGKFFTDKDGKFDQQKYQDALKKIGIGEDAYAEFVRMQIKMGKLRQYVASQIIVTPAEVAATYSDLNTVLHFKTALLSQDNVGKPKPEELVKFFDGNKEAYRCIKVVKFPVAEGKSEEARKKADGFLNEVRKSEAGKRAAAFDDVAKTQKLKVIPTVWVAVTGENSGGLKAADLVKKVFAISVRNPLTQVIVGEKAVYVGCLVAEGSGGEASAKAPMLERHWRIAKIREYAERDAEKLNEKSAGEREKAFLALKKTKKAKIADDVTFSKNEAYKNVQELQINAMFAQNDPARAGQIVAKYNELLDKINRLPRVRNGFAVAFPNEAGAEICLITKREPPKAEMPQDKEAYFREICFEQKLQAAWTVFEEDVRSNCNFLANQEGQN